MTEYDLLNELLADNGRIVLKQIVHLSKERIPEVTKLSIETKNLNQSTLDFTVV
jgi:hypothetical protein